ncbi:MAG: hypothetical protein KGI28_10190 [Thaumarchaeota archaeon]|nr:hypothetical protein [Nitrososphaerota archaeon]
MRLFWKKEREKETIRDNSRTNEVRSTTKDIQTRSDEGKTTSKEDSSRLRKGELDCEEAIIQDKERFGRVRKSLMNYLRSEYGVEMANRALWRTNKRRIGAT